VPVVISGDEVAFQVIIVGALLLGCGSFQMLLQPWRGLIANIVDGAIASIMTLMLMCGGMAGNADLSVDTLGILGLVLVLLGLASIMGAIVYCVYDRFTPRPWYDYFVCHHKAAAAGQSRYLQLMLRRHLGKSCFLDSDDLIDLTSLFDTVRSRVGHLLPYLTAATLTRPWCAGEVVVTKKSHLKCTPIVHASFTPPTEAELRDVGSYIDASLNLSEYNMTLQDVAHAFRWLNEKAKNPTAIQLSELGNGRQMFEGLVSKIGGVAKYAQSPKLALNDKLDKLIISSDVHDHEATAATGILLAKVQEDLLSIVRGDLCIMADLDCNVSDEQLISCVSRARSVLVMLTSGTLESKQQLQIICYASERKAHMIPILTPNFNFPTASYYANVLPQVLVVACKPDVSRYQSYILTFFKTIAVALSTHAGDSVLNTQAKQVARRIPTKALTAVQTYAGPPQGLPTPLDGGDGQRWVLPEEIDI